MNWLVASVRPNCEAVAARDLARAAVECISPRYRDSLAKLRLVFPGYVFALEAREDAATAVPRARGVISVIGKLAHAQLEPWLDYREKDQFYPGRAVELRRVGVYGRVEGLGSDESRIRVLWRMLGREVRSELRRADLILA